MNIFGILEDDIEDIIESTFSKDELLEEAAWAARDITSSLRVLPRHLKWFLRDFAKKGYAIEVKNTGYEKELKAAVGAMTFMGFSIIASVMVFTGVYLLSNIEITHWSQIPTISWVLWSVGVILFSSGIASLRR
jgi:ubiquinone biosynthesis protein